MGERQYKRRDFLKTSTLAGLGALAGCGYSSSRPDPCKTGTMVYVFQGYDNNGQAVPADLDRNGVSELAEVDQSNKKLVRILWGDYLKQEEQGTGRTVQFRESREGVKIRFANQEVIGDGPLYLQPVVPYCELEPVRRPAPQPVSSQQSILQPTPAPPIPTPPQPAPASASAQIAVAPQPNTPPPTPQPPAPATQQPSTPAQSYQAPQPATPQQSGQTPDFTNYPKFRVRKPVGEIGYFDTAAMMARHPHSMIDYKGLEQKAREQFERNRDCEY